MPNLVKSINLTEEDKAALESILRQSTVEARTYIRAKILLLKSEIQMSILQINSTFVFLL